MPETDAAWKVVCLRTQHLCHSALQARVQRDAHIPTDSTSLRWPCKMLGEVAARYPSFPVSNSSAQMVTCVGHNSAVG